MLKKIPLRYEEEYHNINIKNTRLFYRIFGKPWTEFKKEVRAIEDDYSGILPLREGYKYNNKIYSKLEDAHIIKIQNEFPIFEKYNVLY